MGRNLVRAAVPVVLSALVGVLVALGLGQAIVVWSTDIGVNTYTDQVMTHFRRAVGSARHIEEELRESKAETCSAPDLSHMRQLAFASAYIIDIGRVKDGLFSCNTWGRLEEPIAMPEPQRVQPSGFKLWSNVEHFLQPGLTVSVVARDSVVLFMAQRVQAVAMQPPSGFGAIVLTHDGQHVFQTIGDVSWLPRLPANAQDGWLDFGSRRLISACAENVDLCVIAGNGHADILHQQPLILLGICLAGLLTGGSLGLSAVEWRKARLSVPEQLRRAITQGRLTMVYQPLVRLADEKIVGAEALSRLSDDNGWPISPDVFVPLAEETGLMGTLTRKVAETAITEMASWLRQPSAPHLSINVAISDILDDTMREFLNDLTGTLGIDRNRIVLEVTERSTTNHEELIAAMDAYREAGYRFYIDDFGTGYSNLAYLNRLPIDGIKIDKMFTQSMTKDSVNAAIVEDVCRIAQTLKVDFIAEGIELAEHAQHVRGLHPDILGQGWLFSEPVTATVFLDLVRRKRSLAEWPRHKV